MEVARHWRLKKQRYALVGEVCPHCEVKIFPRGISARIVGKRPRSCIISAAGVRSTHTQRSMMLPPAMKNLFHIQSP